MSEIKDLDDPGTPADVMAALLTEALGKPVTEGDVIAARAQGSARPAAVSSGAAAPPQPDSKPKRGARAKPEPVPAVVEVALEAEGPPAPPCVKVVKSDASVVLPGVRRPGVAFGDVFAGPKAAHLWANHRDIVRPFP